MSNQNPSEEILNNADEIIEGEVTNQESVAPKVSDISDLVLVVSGQVVESNLAEVAKQITANIDAIPEELETDEDFTNAEKVAKSLRSAKKQLVARRDEALKAAEELNAEFELIRQIEDKCDAKALTLEKLVRDEKKRKKERMVDQSYASCEHHYDAYIDDHNDFRLARPSIENFNYDTHMDVIKGCSSWSSMQERLDNRAAEIKAAIDVAFKAVMSNAKAIDDTGLPALFQDRKQLLLMEQEHLGSEIRARVATHEAAEAKKKAAEEKAEAERVAAEEAEKLAAAELAKQEAAKSQEAPATELEHQELDHQSLMDDEPPFEPDNAPQVDARNIDTTPPFGAGAPVSKKTDVGLASSSPAPATNSAIDDGPLYRSLEINISITATEERAKQIANIAHGRFKNMPEVHRVGLKDPGKKFRAIIEQLKQANEHRAAAIVEEMVGG